MQHDMRYMNFNITRNMHLTVILFRGPQNHVISKNSMIIIKSYKFFLYEFHYFSVYMKCNYTSFSIHPVITWFFNFYGILLYFLGQNYWIITSKCIFCWILQKCITNRGEVKYKVMRGHPEMMLISLLLKKNNI